MTFDVTDKQYQLKDDIKPDKESTWKHPAEKDGWTHAHNSLRAEMRMMVEALEAAKSRAGPLKPWEAVCIQTFWKGHFDHIHSHHGNEDAILVPFLQTRFKYPDKYEADHKELEAMLESLNTMCAGVKEGSTVAELCKVMQDYETAMLPHLLEEEEQCLPLMRAYFTPEEIGPKIQEIIGNGPKVEIGSFVDCMGVTEFRNEFMPQEGIPGFVWYIDFYSRHNLFIKTFKTPATELKAGEETKVVGYFESWCSIQ